MPDQSTNPSPDPKNHNRAVDAVNSVLGALHPAGSFDLKVVTRGNVSVAVATDNRQFLEERRLVQDNLKSIDIILELGEKRPAPGSKHEIEVGGNKGQIIFDSMDNLLKFAQLGIDCARRHYTLTPQEEEQIGTFLKRMEQLRG